MTFYERLDSLLQEKRITKTALADALDIRRQIFAEWKKNGNSPKSDLAQKIANFLGVSVDYLLIGITEEDKTAIQNWKEISDEEKELIELWRNLPEEKKAAIKMLMRG